MLPQDDSGSTTAKRSLSVRRSVGRQLGRRQANRPSWSSQPRQEASTCTLFLNGSVTYALLVSGFTATSPSPEPARMVKVTVLVRPLITTTLWLGNVVTKMVSVLGFTATLSGLGLTRMAAVTLFVLPLITATLFRPATAT